jgi:adenosylcobyric acid synthase
MTARALAVLGTGSDVGKSLITAGICRLLHRAGMRVAPFKAQNMSLNSFVTPEGGEIGRAQALQAEACGIPPHVDMNPILLKPESDNRSQVVVRGTVWPRQEAATYYEQRPQLWSIVKESYLRLASQYEMIVIEGAGSAAEVNLRERDLVNWSVAHLADAHVVLVADIDRGGVFAQVLGTLDLLQPDERARVRGVIINKFRGDAKLFADGVSFIESRSGVPVLGVVPFLRDLMLDQEDGLDLDVHRQRKFSSERINIAVILLPYMSNFTDFNPMRAEPDVILKYITKPSELADADVVIIPGSKNTLVDLSLLRELGYGAVLDRHIRSGRELVGICGGYQMLGRTISDPYGVEQGGVSEGLGYLSVETELTQTKCTTQVEATPMGRMVTVRHTVRGYQVHMGVTKLGDERPCFQIRSNTPLPDKDHLSMDMRKPLWDGAIR